MPCYHPIKAWYDEEVNGTGKRSLVFSEKYAIGAPFQIACGQCIGCRLEKSRQWAIRCCLEAELWPDNCFITLTFDDKHLDKSGSLVKRDFVLFMKRLRERFRVEFPRIRFFHCGEYGEKFSRPHHHACLFNFRFPDLELISDRDGVKLYSSEILNELWPYGFSTVGDVTFESAAYVARYCTKKINGVRADKHYNGRLPEYVTMSLRPGIGSDWYDKFKSDVYPHNYVVIRNGVKCKPPKYFERKFEIEKPLDMESIKMDNRIKAESSLDNKPDRLAVRERLQYLRSRRLKRGLECC